MDVTGPGPTFSQPRACPTTECLFVTARAAAGVAVSQRVQSPVGALNVFSVRVLCTQNTHRRLPHTCAWVCASTSHPHGPLQCLGVCVMGSAVGCRVAPVSLCGHLSVEHVVEMGTLQASGSPCPDSPQRRSPPPLPLPQGGGPQCP